ncbi:MAG: beta-galactosidase [Bryobacteraceae bacterium]
MTALVALWLAAWAAGAPDFLPMAVWYGGGKARAPMLEPDPLARKPAWRRELRQIRELGFNAIRCWIDWASGEPEPGRYRFETVETVLELAREQGLKVIVQVYMDAAPEWVGRKFTDAHLVAINGQVLKPETAPGYCMDHPGVRKAALAFYSALAHRIRRHPAFYGWDLWSEPHIVNWASAPWLPNAEFCFCPHTLARFRAWLAKKYGTLEELNRAWYRRFASWDEVEPNRLSTILSYTDYIDWRAFIADKLGQDLRERYEAVKRVAPDRVATSHAAAPNLFTSPLAGDGSPDDWIMSRQVDYYGTSFYPKHSYPVGRDAAFRGALLDFARSSGGGRGFWVGELQAGFGTVGLNVSAWVTPADLRIWTWSALVRGARAINYYAWYPMSSGYESGGFGLIELNGAVTDRARAAGEIARTVSRHQRLLLGARPLRAEVAIVYNPLAYMVGGRQRVVTVGPQSEVAGIERNSMLGVYRAWFPSNVPVDFIHVDELAQRARQYKLIYFPYPLMLTEAAARALEAYLREGGALVAEARLAWNNERGRAAETIPGLGLDRVFGCREAMVQSVASLWTELIWEAKDFPGLAPGERLAGRLYEESLVPHGEAARVVARFASRAPAAVESRYGKGKTLALGSLLGAAYEQKQAPGLARFFAALLDWADVSRPVQVRGLPLEVRMMEAGEERLLAAFHHGTQAGEAEIVVRPGPGEWRGEDLENGAAVGCARENGNIKLKKRFDREEAWIIRLRPPAR